MPLVISINAQADMTSFKLRHLPLLIYVVYYPDK